MAYLFSLSAECESDAAAQTFARHFDAYVIEVPSGSHRCHAPVVNAYEGLWVVVSPENVGSSGVVDDAEQVRMDGIAVVLYERLRTAPPFRYALVGVEVDGFCHFSELKDGTIVRYDGLVLSDEIWRYVGCPSTFVPFAAGARWRPFVKVR